MTKSYCVLTKTFAGDIEAFRNLCESIDRVMPQVMHFVLHDRADRDLLKEFAGANRTLIECTRYLPELREFQLFGRRIWYRPPHRFVRGWIHQQLAKIAVVASLDFDAVILVDSDARFIAPIRPDQVFDGSRLRLFHNPGAPSGPVSESAKWHDVASVALGLEPKGYSGADYISTAVVWSPAVVRDLMRHIETAHQSPWFEPLIRPFRFSEYVLYGIFCEHVPGPHQDLVTLTTAELAHCSWNYDFAKEGELDRFVEDMNPDQIAVLVQSNLNMSEAEREAVFQRIVAKFAGQV